MINRTIKKSKGSISMEVRVVITSGVKDEIHFSGSCSDKDALASLSSPNLKSCSGHCLVRRTETRAGISSRTYTLVYLLRRAEGRSEKAIRAPWVPASSSEVGSWRSHRKPLLAARSVEHCVMGGF